MPAQPKAGIQKFSQGQVTIFKDFFVQINFDPELNVIPYRDISITP